MRYIAYDPRAAERLDDLRFRALTHRAIANAVNRRHAKPKAQSAFDVFAAKVIVGAFTLAAIAQALVYYAS